MVIYFEKIHPKAVVPEKKSEQAAGYDIFACLEKELTIYPLEVVAVPTGLRLAIPERFHLSIRPRSGLALHHQITLINSPATIDSDFRGELKILMINLGKEPYTIQHGDRIAQALLEKNYHITWQEGKLNITQRGEGGFGSTGR